MITGAQCRAARALVEFTRERLAILANVPASTIEEFERKIAKPDADVVRKLKSALQDAGAVFIPENGGGAGVRLKFKRADVERIATLENEGGIARLDDVP